MSRSIARRSYEACGAARMTGPFSRASQSPLLLIQYRLGLFMQRTQERADVRSGECLSLTIDDEERIEGLMFARDDRLATRMALCEAGLPLRQQPDFARKLEALKAGSR